MSILLAAVASSSVIRYAAPGARGRLSDFVQHGSDMEIPCWGRRGHLVMSLAPNLANGVVLFNDGVTMVAVEGCDALITIAETVIHIMVVEQYQIELKLALAHYASLLKLRGSASITAT